MSNKNLRDSLGWGKDKYDRIKQQYALEGTVQIGKGRGGSVALPEEKIEPLKVFISYSHKDEVYKKQLEAHLKPLIRRNLVMIWSDRQIVAGEEWNKEIFKEIEASDIILLLVSVDFINSDFCYEKELEKAMEKHDSEETIVIPILLRNCKWKDTLFSKIQAAPKDAKPVVSWLSIDDAFVDIVESIERAADKIREARFV